MTFKARLYKTLFPLAKIYWFIVRPKTRGAGCIIECEGKILLVMNTYGGIFWSFPGGGVKRNENPEEAARREVYEEVGIKISDIKFIGSFVYLWRYRTDNVSVFTGYVDSENIKIDEDEILEAKWVEASNIKSIDLSGVGDKMFEFYNKYKKIE